jgi:glycosyltransferase involved in cell wall biosynthesis
MKTILHTEASGGWGGQEIRILAEARWLSEQGWRVLLAAQPESPILGEAGRSGLRAFPVRMRAAWDVRAMMALAKLIEREGAGLVHTHSSIDGWVGGIAARFTRTPVVRSRHVSIPVRRRWNPVYSLLADRVVASSDAIRDALVAAGVDRAKIVTLPAGVDLDRFGPAPASGELRAEFRLTSPVIGSVAMFRGSKGHQHLVDAFTIVLGEFPSASLLLVGDGIRRAEVERLVAERGLSRSVKFTGFRHDVPELLRLMDCFLLSSVREGIPQALLQALASEIPVVATRVGGVGEVVVDGVTGLTVNAGDPEGLGAAVLATLRDPEAARRRAKAGRQLVETRFSRAAFTDRMIAVYEAILAP